MKFIKRTKFYNEIALALKWWGIGSIFGVLIEKKIILCCECLHSKPLKPLEACCCGLGFETIKINAGLPEGIPMNGGWGWTVRKDHQFCEEFVFIDKKIGKW